MKNNKIVEIFSKHQPKTPLTFDESKFLVSMLMDKSKTFDVLLDEVDKESEVYKHFKPLIDSFQVQVFLGRLKNFTTHKITLGALVMLSLQLHSAGAAVLMTYYLHHKLPDNTLINIDVYSMKLFPFGVFSEEQFNEIWDAQKVSNLDDMSSYKCIGAYDNLVDYLEFWEKE